jgi:prepilin-type N-terminal cleavage/methylation domain-containing protein
MKARWGSDCRAIAKASRNASPAFTLVEIAIVVAIIGVLAVLVIPGIVKARKQSQGQRIVNDVREMDAAINQWALEHNQVDGVSIDTTQVATYLKKGWPPKDILGNNFRVRTLGSNQITISTRTKNRLAGVGIDWGAY